MGARTPLLRILQGISHDYSAAEQLGCTVQAVQAERRAARRIDGLTRREILKSGAFGATGAVIGPRVLPGGGHPAAGTTAPRIAIIGAGIAGLNAALTLQDGTNKVPGYASVIFEAQDYIGGRMHSDTTSWANGQVSERCGELIDSSHTTITNLAARFNLTLTDVLAAQPTGSTDLYYFFGRYYPYSQAVADFAPVYETLRSQIKAAGYPTLYNSYNAAGYNLDHMSNYEWIEKYVPVLQQRLIRDVGRCRSLCWA